ncbi:MAG: nuclear transport factor 2 family protein [Proteobacteria bacterium]|nr:nuclear transport factor 2 family protein [Pseudomonadota bacterium]
MCTRSTAEVVNDHLSLAQQGGIETDIDRNFAPDCVLMTTYGVFRGHAGLRDAARLLQEQLGETGYEYRTRLCHGELGFLEWTASSGRGRIDDGADSYWVHDGLIRAMTIHYTVKPPVGSGDRP